MVCGGIKYPSVHQKVSIDSGEDWRFSHTRFPRRDTYTILWASVTFVVISFGKIEKGNWFLPHKRATFPPLQATVLNSCVWTCPPRSIKLIISLCLSPGLGSRGSVLSWHPLFSLLHFLCNGIWVIYMLTQERKTIPFHQQIYDLFLLETWRADPEVFHVQWHQLLCFKISTNRNTNLSYSKCLVTGHKPVSAGNQKFLAVRTVRLWNTIPARGMRGKERNSF